MEVAFIRFTGATTDANVTWTSLTNWSLPITLQSGANTNSVQGYDRRTNAIPGTNDSITIYYP